MRSDRDRDAHLRPQLVFLGERWPTIRGDVVVRVGQTQTGDSMARPALPGWSGWSGGAQVVTISFSMLVATVMGKTGRVGVVESYRLDSGGVLLRRNCLV